MNTTEALLTRIYKRENRKHYSSNLSWVRKATFCLHFL